MLLFGIKNCGSVQKARKFMDQRGIVYDFIDLKMNAPAKIDIQKWVELKGIEIVLNSKGATYKNLGLKNMDLDLSDKIDLCHKNPLLLKRPIIDNLKNNQILIGFNEEEYKTYFVRSEN
ncbi:arsenate reductase family protein [Helicobacter sp. 13S00477-4]|uniref:arsenate reductase family protein n=1 Tax=Helicobacter sp. 13S00477-4 TaxID=1905759 RepID=UPI000BA7DEA1|nr:arsenate reductase family protein [Helicobacter sp. 13S00477-4]PAF50815.1 hypothetical protein BKH44_06590 [Helicobacter sp. 13S00477-4]